MRLPIVQFDLEVITWKELRNGQKFAQRDRIDLVLSVTIEL